eukprot:10021381-Prorocentrum_lima.AAC.1
MPALPVGADLAGDGMVAMVVNCAVARSLLSDEGACVFVWCEGVVIIWSCGVVEECVLGGCALGA